ncbi:MAG: CusA/CzcA family heavy metal efflux RND transporter [Myxococcales bacterium]
MLESLVDFSVRRRGGVLVAWALVAVASVFALRKLSVDAVPDVTNTQVQILTSGAGLSPIEVEQYLTYPVEAAVNGVPHVTEIRSISRTGVSVVTVVFDDETDVWFARQLISERLKLAEADIPDVYGRPELAPVSTGLGQIYEFYLSSDRHTPMELRTLLDWVVAYKLRSVPGVIEVNAMGGEAKQYQVVLDPGRLMAHELTLSQVLSALQRNNLALGAGYIEKGQESYTIRGDAQFKSLSDIEKTVVTVDRRGSPVLLRHLGSAQLGPALRFGTVTKLDEGEIVTGTVMMLIGANSREVVASVKQRLEAIQHELPEGVEIHAFYDRAEFIGRMLETVAINLAEGALLVVVVLFLTLGSFRGSLIAALAIPLSMGIALIGMVRLKVTGNLMSLGAIDFGLLVDGAIVMLETTLAALAIKHVQKREDVAQVVSEAMRRAARPVTFALAIILMVYLPLMALEGVEGRMFRPMAITVALALFGALAFSLTAFPALAAYVLASPKHAHDEHAGFFGWLRRVYGRVLGLVLARPQLTLAGATSALVLTFVCAGSLGAEFVPRLEEGELAIDTRRLPSVSIGAAQQLNTQMEQVLKGFPEVLSVVSRTGRPEVPTDPVGPDESDLRVKLKPKEEWVTAHDLDGLGEAIKLKVEAEVPATFVAVSQPIEDRVNQLLAGSKGDLVIKVFGPDLVRLKAFADRIGRAIKNVPGTGDLRVQRVLGLPLLEVKPDRDRLARYGITAEEVLDVVEAARVGRPAGLVFEGQRRFELRLRMPPPDGSTDALGSLPVGSAQGHPIPLNLVADIKEAEGPAVINREALERRVVVEINVRGRDLVSYVADAKAAVAALAVPKDMHLVWGGQFENFERASARLGLVVPVALGVIFGMLFLMFGSLRYAAAVFAGAPFALIGGVLSLFVRELPFSIPAAVGFIAVAGVAVLNGVVMASEVKRRLALSADQAQALFEGALSVLRPVITTALVAAIGFFPMAISTRAGAEVQRPLATVVIGGILSSTVLSLVVLPVLLRLLVTRREPAAVASAPQASEQGA